MLLISPHWEFRHRWPYVEQSGRPGAVVGGCTGGAKEISIVFLKSFRVLAMEPQSDLWEDFHFFYQADLSSTKRTTYLG